MALAGLAAAYGLHAHFAPKAQPDWQYCLWATTGAALLFAGLGGGLLAAWQAFRKRHDASGDLVLLVAWAAALAVFSIVWAPFQAVRHFLPVLPPLAVVVMRLLGPPRRLVSIALGAMLAAQVGVACLVAAADCEHAGAYRAFARYGAERYAGAGQEVWFNGHWGWQHYALARGFKQISLHGAAPPPGAIVLEPKWVSRSSYPPGLKLVPVEERIYMARLPVRTMDSVNSYFYSVTKRRMPYYFTAERTPVQIGQVFRVEASGKPSRP
jgi:hypothetical protein